MLCVAKGVMALVFPPGRCFFDLSPQSSLELMFPRGPAFSFLIGVVPASLPRQVVMRSWEACLGCLGDTAMAVTAVTALLFWARVRGMMGGVPCNSNPQNPGDAKVGAPPRDSLSSLE